ncbi:HPF/RaiA family ribosome-associated protein [Actinokineospora sp. UTMC 2448]|uniref:HPF/RaiA family ribosome-associated protein n=1 Tax=Actinokineospora sp. UTMC 2448 TaxID=2268449 RepID=UPI002164BB7C|nr:HPF/RaiA family ribosome-associated protein [Actinokineospora sp. UTMC 2448]UVS79444.1 Sigma 54 modulation protein / S30EA ribosomal protein [Actinokineospora sp. UTMC 2448]
MSHATTDRTAPIVTVRGVLGLGIGEYAEAKVNAALEHAHGPVHRVRITITRLPDPAVAEAVEATSHVDVDGTVLHTHARADTARTAVDRLTHRLARQLRTHSRRRRGHRVTTVHDGPAPGRTVVSHPTYSADRCSVEDAIADMEALDYAFHLFTHTSGEDCLLRRTTEGYLLSAAHGTPPWIGPDLPVWPSDQSAARLTARQAQARLDLSAEPALFYLDDTDGRGRLLYRRDDGGYGLVTAAD